MLKLLKTLIFVSVLAVASSKSSASSRLALAKVEAVSSMNTADLVAVAAASSDKVLGGSATTSSSIFNLAKSIIGAGVLSLPSGVAFFSDSPASLIPAAVLTLIMGTLAAYSFSLIGRACDQHKTKSFQDTWAKSVDEKTAWLISAGITAKCFLASLAYSIIIGDTFASLANTFNLPELFRSRSNMILLLTGVVLLPLCSMQSLSALAPFSLLGLGGTLYTAIFMAIRFFDKSYVSGGKFFSDIATSAQPSFNKNGMALDQRIFVLASMLSTSFIAHYNAPKFLAELQNPTIARFNQVVSGGFGIAMFLSVFMMGIGFLTFGGNSLGLILNNYSGKDSLATFARVAIGAALLTGYPFTFSALREGVLDLLNFSGEKRSSAVLPFTVLSLSLVTALALTLRDVGFVVSLSGALFGCILMFVVPGLMNIANLKAKTKGKPGMELSSHDKFELKFDYGLVALGLVLTGLGVAVTLNRQMGGH